MTKKQLAALRRIMDREIYQQKSRNALSQPNYDPLAEKTAGIHPSKDRAIVTDGYVAVMFDTAPEGLPEANRMDGISELILRDMDMGDHTLALTVRPSNIDEWKKLAGPWKKGKTQHTGAVPAKITAVTHDGAAIEGFYNPLLLLDAVDAIGSKAMLYIGHYGITCPYCSMLVRPDNWMENQNRIVGYVLPIRM